ncbi:MAG: hypothetical protein JO100_16170 [Pseudonocardia sp.]|nr:hypothetical protein [Pseudonocardia sp.]
MPSLQSLEVPLRAVEARLAEVEGSYGDTLYRLRRESISIRITLGRIAGHLGLAVASRTEVDAALDEET